MRAGCYLYYNTLYFIIHYNTWYIETRFWTTSALLSHGFVCHILIRWFDHIKFIFSLICCCLKRNCQIMQYQCDCMNLLVIVNSQVSWEEARLLWSCLCTNNPSWHLVVLGLGGQFEVIEILAYRWMFWLYFW